MPRPEDMLQYLSEAVVLTGSNGDIAFLNDAACEILEVRRETAIGKPAVSVLRDHRLETALIDGGTVELHTRQRVLLARGVPDGLIIQDVTESRRAREEARELLAVLSHELRTPATSIRSALEALATDDLPPAMRQRFQGLAEAEAERLVRLLGDLTVDVKPPELRSVPLQASAERARAVLTDVLQEHDVTVDLSAVPDLTVWADEDKLLQSLVNLIENAAQHGPGSSTVEVLAVEDPDVQEVRVMVRDRGVPLAEERLEELFSPDSKVRSTRARGTGLGLYIVRSIAQRWGGRAWGRPLEAGNEFGFSVRLPRERN